MRLTTLEKHIDFYPRPPRGGRPAATATDGFAEEISIHALREEGDVVIPDPAPVPVKFLSTPSARRATVIDGNNAVSYEISIHALREEGDLRISDVLELRTSISIHALREEGDRPQLAMPLLFLISIHALREEGDLSYFLEKVKVFYFYPRPPRGGRLRPIRWYGVPA